MVWIGGSERASDRFVDGEGREKEVDDVDGRKVGKGRIDVVVE